MRVAGGSISHSVQYRAENSHRYHIYTGIYIRSATSLTAINSDLFFFSLSFSLFFTLFIELYKCINFFFSSCRLDPNWFREGGSERKRATYIYMSNIIQNIYVDYLKTRPWRFSRISRVIFRKYIDALAISACTKCQGLWRSLG